ncbi:MAG: ABC transporter ATP-binding protein/permease, partial [Lachnospiraceae bacterium]|nr:ABC transporter ATP-binding protein/permease [Lachnospiraceae bacterium]
IVGENGSGKTTLIKLICRLYQPSEGKILLNGTDIADIPFEKYIACIATVFQDFSLFPFSMGENIAASGDYDAAKVEEALAKAGLEEKLLQWKNGVRQSIFSDFDENGADLSGGEQQKAAIARAVYKDAELMVLDEPTAALDPYAEYEIYKNFSEITEGKTLISISHRLSSCRMCDRILVLGEGKVLQEGSHEELVKDLDGKYYALWNAQAQYYYNFEPNTQQKNRY